MVPPALATVLLYVFLDVSYILGQPPDVSNSIDTGGEPSIGYEVREHQDGDGFSSRRSSSSSNTGPLIIAIPKLESSKQTQDSLGLETNHRGDDLQLEDQWHAVSAPPVWRPPAQDKDVNEENIEEESDYEEEDYESQDQSKELTQGGESAQYSVIPLLTPQEGYPGIHLPFWAPFLRRRTPHQPVLHHQLHAILNPEYEGNHPHPFPPLLSPYQAQLSDQFDNPLLRINPYLK